MKKILIIVFLILFVYLETFKEYNIEEETIRFRVIANSNSTKDIIIKEKVVNEVSELLFNNNDSYNETDEKIYNNLKNIEDKIDNLFSINNYNQKFNILYGLNEFPRKKYRGKTYEAGKYKSLVIEIGEAKGNNYFCILYPSLCMLDIQDENNDENIIRFKFIEIIKDMF